MDKCKHEKGLEDDVEVMGKFYLLNYFCDECCEEWGVNEVVVVPKEQYDKEQTIIKSVMDTIHEYEYAFVGGNIKKESIPHKYVNDFIFALKEAINKGYGIPAELLEERVNSVSHTLKAGKNRMVVDLNGRIE